MAVLFKILFLLCFLSATLSLRLDSRLSVRNPLGLDFSLGRIGNNINNNLINNLNSPSRQCFCIPNTASSRPVTSVLNLPNENTQRLVVYIYNNNGNINIYVPNKNKQELIPEINFDEGDILTPVSAGSISDVINYDIIKSQATTVPASQAIVQGPDTSEIENTNVEQQNINPSGSGEQINQDNEQSSIVPSDANTGVEENSPLNEENSPLNEENIPIENDNNNSNSVIIQESSSEIQGEDTNNPTQSLENSLALQPQESQEIPNQDTAGSTNSQESGIIPDVLNSDQVQQIVSPGNEDKDKIINSVNYDQIQQNMLGPQQSQSQSELLLPQEQYITNLLTNPYITFNDWFEIQLKGVVLYNLNTQSKLIELRERIKRIFLNNRMNISPKGIVTDSKRELVRMNTIKLRPILIGRQIDPQSFLDPTIFSKVSYIQLIEVIKVAPPTLLGTLIMGTVYLPRNIQGAQNVDLWNYYRQGNSEVKPRQGCVLCKHKGFNVQDPSSRTSSPAAMQAVPVPHPPGPYYALPFRRKISKYGLPYEGRRVISVEPRRGKNDVFIESRNGILEGIIGNILGVNPTRRLLGGRVPSSPRPGPRGYPNDVLPGYRIIGGNPATSSGTPLVNKGRSAFDGPSYII